MKRSVSRSVAPRSLASYNGPVPNLFALLRFLGAPTAGGPYHPHGIPVSLVLTGAAVDRVDARLRLRRVQQIEQVVLETPSSAPPPRLLIRRPTPTATQPISLSWRRYLENSNTTAEWLAERSLGEAEPWLRLTAGDRSVPVPLASMAEALIA